MKLPAALGDLPRPLHFFDGYCVLCNGLIAFCLSRGFLAFFAICCRRRIDPQKLRFLGLSWIFCILCISCRPPPLPVPDG